MGQFARIGPKIVQKFEGEDFLTSDLGIAAAVLCSGGKTLLKEVIPDDTQDGRFLFKISGDMEGVKEVVLKWWSGQKVAVDAREYAYQIRMLKNKVNKGKGENVVEK